MYRILTTLLMLITLSACQNATVASLPAPSFKDLPAFKMDLATIEVVEEYISPFKAPNVEHLFPTPPAASFKIWMADRIQKTGQSNRLVATIRDASVIETALPRTTGFKGAFTKDQVARYDASIAVELKIYKGDDLISFADVTASAKRSRTIGEDASPEERDQIFYTINQELLSDLNKQLETDIRTYFAEFLR